MLVGPMSSLRVGRVERAPDVPVVTLVDRLGDADDPKARGEGQISLSRRHARRQLGHLLRGRVLLEHEGGSDPQVEIAPCVLVDQDLVGPRRQAARRSRLPAITAVASGVVGISPPPSASCGGSTIEPANETTKG